MAFRAAPRKKLKTFEVSVEDETLREVLSANKSGVVLENGFVRDQIEDRNIPEDEPLPDDINNISGSDSNTLNYAAVQERANEEYRQREDPSAIKANKKMSRKLTARKFFETIICIFLIVAIGVFVMLLLYPQTEISELARDNSNLKDQINITKREIVNAEENANGIADMDVIRAQALALGMQDPNQNQVINLPVPNTDTLRTRANYNSEGISDEAFKDSKDALADYYAAHPDK